MSVATHSGIFREVNERIATIIDSWEWEDRQGFLCECVHGECAESVQLTRAEYEAVRAGSARFFTITGHEQPDQERVIERHEAYVVVEKLGAAQREAELEDPRAEEQTAEGS